MEQKTKKVGLPVDLIRAVAIFLVILLHVSIQGDSIPVPTYLSPSTVWWAVDFYETIARPCVPLFIMLSGYLLLQPYKVDEPIKTFFKKRWHRIGLPFIFWSVVYFGWLFFFGGQTFSVNSVVNGVLNGPYITFWFIYMLVGLYLLTPMLRVFMAHTKDDIVKFILIIWFIGTGIVPIAGLLGLGINNNLFVLPGWIGYFLIGAYLPRVKTRSWGLYALMAGGFAFTMIASAFMAAVGGETLYFFYDYLTANVIIASIAMFKLLSSVSAKSAEPNSSRVNWLIRQISHNTLPIYFFHMLLLEAFRRGLFGFTLTIMSSNPIITIPLLSLFVLFLSLGAVSLLKKIPFLRSWIG